MKEVHPMIYVCQTEHIKTGKTHVFRTVYDYKHGDIIYPWHLQSEYPGHNENRHRVIVNVPLDNLTKSQMLKLFGQASV